VSGAVEFAIKNRSGSQVDPSGSGTFRWVAIGGVRFWGQTGIGWFFLFLGGAVACFQVPLDSHAKTGVGPRLNGLGPQGSEG
jgi:hypothetical protein